MIANKKLIALMAVAGMAGEYMYTRQGGIIISTVVPRKTVLRKGEKAFKQENYLYTYVVHGVSIEAPNKKTAIKIYNLHYKGKKV